MEPDDADTPKQRPLSAYRAARRFLLGAAALGVAMPFVFAAQASSLVAAAPVVVVGLGVVTASMSVGGLIGFIFGIPTSLQDTREAGRANADATNTTADDRQAPYAGNTSLEQISDWLTKILVGVGLTQLAAIPTGLGQLGEFLAGGLGDLPGAAAFAPALVVFTVLDGFFLGYLWTRLHLPSLFAESDFLQRIAAAEERGVKLGEQQAITATSTAVAAAAEAVSAGAATPMRLAPEGRIRALWVDDHPENNTREADLIQRLLGVEFDIAKDTDEAMTALTGNRDAYAFVITDMGRGTDRQAGYTLLRRMQEEGIRCPAVIYAATASAQRDVEARNRGAIGATNSPSRLLELVSQVVRSLPPAPKERTKPGVATSGPRR